MIRPFKLKGMCDGCPIDTSGACKEYAYGPRLEGGKESIVVRSCLYRNESGHVCRLESISTIRSRFLSFLKCSSARGEVVLATSPPLYIFNGTSIIIMKSMEIEIRAKIRNPKKIISSLKKTRVLFLLVKKQKKDIYFKHSTDTDRKLVLRIRRTKMATC